MKKITRRNFLKVAAGATFATATACAVPSTSTSESSSTAVDTSSSVSSDSASSDEIIKLTIVDWSDSSSENRAVFHEEFKVTHPNVEIEYTPMTSEQFATTIVSLLKSGDAPDLFPIPSGSGMTMTMAVEEGWYLPLSDYIEEEFFDQMLESSFVEGATMVDGKIYSIPEGYALSSSVIYYSKPLFAEAGIEKIPETYSEFKDVCQKISEIDGAYGLIDAGSQTARLDLMARAFIGRAGGKINLSDSILTCDGETAYASPEAIAFFDLLEELYAGGCVHPDMAPLNAPEAREYFAQEQAGFIMQGVWCIPVWTTNNPDFEYGAMKVPYPDGFNESNGGVAASVADPWHAIYSGSKHPEMAAEYLKCLYSEEYSYQGANVEMGNNVSVLPTINDEYLTNALMKEFYACAMEMSKDIPDASIVDPNVLNIYGEIVAVQPSFGDIVQGVLTGSITDATPYLETLNEKTTAEWKRAAEVLGIDYSVFEFENWTMAENFTQDDYDAM